MQASSSRSTLIAVLSLLLVGTAHGAIGQERNFSSADELARDQLRQGIDALNSGDQAEAERLLLLSIRSLDNPQARIALSELYYSQGRMEDSLEAAGYAVRRSAGDGEILRRAHLLRTRAAVSVEFPKRGVGVCEQLQSPIGRPWSDEERSELVRVAAGAGCDAWLQEHAEAGPDDGMRWRVLINVLVPKLSKARGLDASERGNLIGRLIDASRSYSRCTGDATTLAQVSWSLAGAGDLDSWALLLDSVDDGGPAWWHYRAAHLAFDDRNPARALAHLSEAYSDGADDFLAAGLRIGFKRVCGRMQRLDWVPDVCSETPESRETWLRLADIVPGSVFSALLADSVSNDRNSEAWRKLAERQPASLIPQPD